MVKKSFTRWTKIWFHDGWTKLKSGWSSSGAFSANIFTVVINRKAFEGMSGAPIRLPL
jgi:hypothetical protein